MKQFRNRIVICLIPIVLAAFVVYMAVSKYQAGQGGFKLGVDLVGGTILVYEIDTNREGFDPNEFSQEELAAAIKRRIDPNDLKNIIIRPVSNTRVEIILPTGGQHQANVEKEDWDKLIQAAREHWPDKLKDKKINVSQGEDDELRVELVKLTGEKPEAVSEFIDNSGWVKPEGGNVSQDEVARIKRIIAAVGSLEFRILANEDDDADAIDAAQRYFRELTGKQISTEEKERREEDLAKRARDGRPPPPPQSADGSSFFDWRTPNGEGSSTYKWVELSKEERNNLQVNNASQSTRMKQAAAARTENRPLIIDDYGKTLLYSRDCTNTNLTDEQRAERKYDYFFLTRDSQPGQEITGDYLLSASSGNDAKGDPAVHFQFNNAGGNLFHEVTTINRPSGQAGGEFRRHLAIILDDKIISAPTLNEPIRERGQISGNFTVQRVSDMVRLLKSGKLPATLKPDPVSENTIGPTLGADTIASGTTAIWMAFVAVLIFMIAYYRFAGFVASLALLVNLLLTVAFMVTVQAAFTLPGLAGIVLMLALAVDANVLIYERIREERDRGSSLALSIRNGYDRAFPTIIDTHLTSILTAIILYVVGTEQLKGFGISLTVGLLISLFTALYMTRLLFDIWNSQGWLKKLSMARLPFPQKWKGEDDKPNLNFMAIRHYFFRATIIFSLFGIVIFLLRGQDGLNIDFVGGTAYGGKLAQNQALSASELRTLLGEDNQAERLDIKDVKSLDDGRGYRFQITYADGEVQPVRFTDVTTIEDVKARAARLPDLSVEQLFLGDDDAEGGKSHHFTVRTSEKAPDLVMVTVDRLLTVDGKPLLEQNKVESTKISGNTATITFKEPASPGYLQGFLEQQFKDAGIKITQPVSVYGYGIKEQGGYRTITIDLSEAAATLVSPEQLKTILAKAEEEFATRPQPERLENFDKTLASESQDRALWAILGSWLVVLLYLWFRFGNWTFGLAAVICLVHDLLFTLGIIAICHYLVVYVPPLANLLLLHDFKIDLTAVAALLTLVGYSVNDTIVVFDRIREVRGKNPELTPQMINTSVNQTLSRTLLTSVITFLTVFVLYVAGGEGIHLFAFVMVVGVFVGTYSSIYVASPLLLIFREGTPSGLRGTQEEEPEEPEEPEEETEEEPAPA